MIYVSDRLKATPAPATGDPTPATSWKWTRNDSYIAGAIADIYTLAEADIGSQVAAEQAASNMMGAAYATSTTLGPVQPFNPIALFGNNEVGTWYDPSDLTTLFQDSAGTIPVTAVQQPVGLMLDKSKGLVLGPELVTNGDFSNGATGWALGTGVSVTASKLTYSSAANFEAASRVIGAVPGKVYRVTVAIDSITAGSLQFLWPGSSVVWTAAGTYSVIIVGGSDARVGLFAIGTTTAQVSVISVKELPGNHAFQTTSASRPVLSARYNLQIYSEDFSSTSSLNQNITATNNAGSSPIGTTTAALLVENTATDQHRSGHYLLTSFVSGVSYTASVYVKRASGTRNVILRIDLGTGNFGNLGTNYNLTTFTVTPSAGQTGTITSVGDGWYRLTLTAASSASYTSSYGVSVNLSSGTSPSDTGYTGDGTSGIYIWGADLRVSNDALSQPAYQRVNTSTDYDTVGFKPYLAFDGVDDSLVTNSIDFTSTDKMTVFAGVRKLSDATAGMLTELSVDFNGNLGSWYLAAPYDSSIPYAFIGRGNGAANSGQTSQFGAGTFRAPDTCVLTATGNISGDANILRRNGLAAATGTADQGTGNYGNYPLFIGRRNQASLPFNGRIYSLIVRGAASTTAQITSTETWVNQRTGAYT